MGVSPAVSLMSSGLAAWSLRFSLVCGETEAEVFAYPRGDRGRGFRLSAGGQRQRRSLGAETAGDGSESFASWERDPCGR